jgi:hypothetical protein
LKESQYLSEYIGSLWSKASIIDFGKIQKDRVAEMKKWAAFLKRDREEQEIINLAIAAANNHHAGLGPATANTFRKMLDLSEVI